MTDYKDAIIHRAMKMHYHIFINTIQILQCFCIVESKKYGISVYSINRCILSRNTNRPAPFPKSLVQAIL